MKLHFLGTTGYHPNARRHTACLMIPEIGVLLDAGSGVFRARDLIQTDSLNVFLTHAHLDHTIGLTYFLDIHFQKLQRNSRVYAEPAKIEAIRQHLFSELLFPVLPALEFCPLSPGEPVPLDRGGRLTHFPLKHPGGALGFRLDFPGGSMAYVTDTTAKPDAYTRQIRGVDLLVHECYFPDGLEERASMTGHSCFQAVIDVAREAGARRLALVHLNPLDPDGAHFDLKSAQSDRLHIFIPDDNDVVDVG